MADAKDRRVTLTAHIDTVVLRALIDDQDDKDLRTGAMKLINSSREPKFRMGHLVVGEAFERLCADHETDRCVAAMTEFKRLVVKGFLEIENAKDLDALHMHIGNLHREDPLLTPNDLLILANAVACEDCRSFYTTDMTILYSTKTSAYARGYRTEIRQVPMREDWAKQRRGYRVKW